jgi:hypothetical protein
MYDWMLKFYKDILTTIYGEFRYGTYLMGNGATEKDDDFKRNLYKFSGIYAREGDDPLYIGWIAEADYEKFKELCESDEIPLMSGYATLSIIIKSNDIGGILSKLAKELGY